jgi:hypothetical protein
MSGMEVPSKAESALMPLMSSPPASMVGAAIAESEPEKDPLLSSGGSHRTSPVAALKKH